MELCPVRPAEIFSAAPERAECNSAKRTDCKSIFRSGARDYERVASDLRAGRSRDKRCVDPRNEAGRLLSESSSWRDMSR